MGTLAYLAHSRNTPKCEEKDANKEAAEAVFAAAKREAEAESRPQKVGLTEFEDMKIFSGRANTLVCAGGGGGGCLLFLASFLPPFFVACPYS